MNLWIRKLLGHNLVGCSMEELEEIENQLEKSVKNIRSRKVYIILYYKLYILFLDIKLIYINHIEDIKLSISPEKSWNYIIC